MGEPIFDPDKCPGLEALESPDTFTLIPDDTIPITPPAITACPDFDIVVVVPDAGSLSPAGGGGGQQAQQGDQGEQGEQGPDGEQGPQNGYQGPPGDEGSGYECPTFNIETTTSRVQCGNEYATLTIERSQDPGCIYDIALDIAFPQCCDCEGSQGCTVPFDCCPDGLPCTITVEITRNPGTPDAEYDTTICGSYLGTYTLTWNESTQRYEDGTCRSWSFLGIITIYWLIYAELDDFNCTIAAKSAYWFDTTCTTIDDAPNTNVIGSGLVDPCVPLLVDDPVSCSGYNHTVITD